MQVKETYMVGESVKLNQDGNYAYANLDDFTGYICEKELRKLTTKTIG